MGTEPVVAKNTKRGPRKGAGPKQKITKDERRKKYTDIARKRRQKQNGNRGGGSRKSIVCYNCRLPGHNAADCPSLGNDEGNRVCKVVSQQKTAILCYKCGSTEHALQNCPKRHRGNRSDLPYATCFVCNEKGHLASACPKNSTGIYVNGGACRKCGSQQHLASNCPEKRKKKGNTDETKISDDEQVLLNDLLRVEEDPGSTMSNTKRETKEKREEKSTSVEPKKKRRLVNF